MRPESKYLATLLAAFVAGLACVAWFNYRVDPAHLFDDGRYAAEAARHMAAGRNVVAANLDERLLQRHYAKRLRAAPRVLVLGSSRIMQVDGSVVPGGGLYNAALSTSTLPDLLALGTLFVGPRHRPATIVIGVDPWLFDERPRNERWRTLEPEYRTMVRRLGGTPEGVRDGLSGNKYFSLISIAYLERSLSHFDGDMADLFVRPAQAVTTVAARHGKVAIRRADGSLGYDEAYRSRGARVVRAAALAQARKHVTAILKSPPLHGPSVALFEHYVAWLRGKGIRVALALTPFHPAHYRHVVSRDRGRSLQRIQAAMRSLARRRGLALLGSFDPASVGCGAKEFWDGMHAKASCLQRLFLGLNGT